VLHIIHEKKRGRLIEGPHVCVWVFGKVQVLKKLGIRDGGGICQGEKKGVFSRELNKKKHFGMVSPRFTTATKGFWFEVWFS